MTKLAAAVFAAAALCATTAQAKTVSITFDGFCNGLDITTSKNAPVITSVENGCAAGAGGGVGVFGKLKNYSGKNYAIGENYDDGDNQYDGEEFWVISAPLVTGGTYDLWQHKTGEKLVKLGSGTYSLLGSAPKSAGSKRLVAH